MYLRTNLYFKNNKYLWRRRHKHLFSLWLSGGQISMKPKTQEVSTQLSVHIFPAAPEGIIRGQWSVTLGFLSEFCWRPPQVRQCTVTVGGLQEAAGLCVTGQLDLIAHLLQNPLVQLDLSVWDRVSTCQNHGPMTARGGQRQDLDLRRQERENTGVKSSVTILTPSRRIRLWVCHTSEPGPVGPPHIRTWTWGDKIEPVLERRSRSSLSMFFLYKYCT